MKRLFLLFTLLGALLLTMAPAGVAEADPSPKDPLFGTWERLSTLGPTESLREARSFRERGDRGIWFGTHKTLPDPRLVGPVPTPAVTGSFSDGAEVDVASLDCWGMGCPADAVFAVRGTVNWPELPSESVFLTTESGMMWMVSTRIEPSGAFAVWAAPWYPTFDEAFAANPEYGEDWMYVADDNNDGTFDFVYMPEEKNCTDGYDNDGDGYTDEEDSACAG
jgi:hypothetical protein